MKTKLLLVTLIAAQAACSAPPIPAPGDDHPANIAAPGGVLPDFALEDDSPLRGEKVPHERSEPAGGHQHHRH